MSKVLSVLKEIVGELEGQGLDPQDVVVQTVAEVTDVGIQSGLVEQDVGVQAINVRDNGVGTSDGSLEKALDIMEVQNELETGDGTNRNNEERIEAVGTNESILAKLKT